MDDVDVRVMNQVSEVMILLKCVAELVLCKFMHPCEVLCINIAKSNETTALVAGKVMP